MRAIIKKSINENKSFSELREEIVKFKNEGGSQNDALRILEDLRIEFEEYEEKVDVILELLDHVAGWCQPQYRIWDEVKLFLSIQDEITKRNLVIEEDENSIWAYLTIPEKTDIDKHCYLGTRNEITSEELNLESSKMANTPPIMVKEYSTDWSQMEDIKEEDFSTEWYQNGNVLLNLKGNPFLLFHKDEPRGFCKSIKEDSIYGNAWNEEKYREILR